MISGVNKKMKKSLLVFSGVYKLQLSFRVVIAHGREATTRTPCISRHFQVFTQVSAFVFEFGRIDQVLRERGIRVDLDVWRGFMRVDHDARVTCGAFATIKASRVSQIGTTVAVFFVTFCAGCQSDLRFLT